MGRYVGLLGAVMFLTGAVFADDSCKIVVHEKTPDCYVTQDEEGCLDIGNEKPVCNDDGKCIAVLPGCDKKTEY